MPRQERTAMYKICERIVRYGAAPFLRIATRGAHNLPATGGYIVCVNHISYIDPIAVGLMLLRLRAYPYFMAKESLFRWPVTGKMLTQAEQIPVYRASSRAGFAYTAAIDAINQGKVVVIFPEGTISRDDELWPMRAKTGAARIALATGCPIVPIATWGGQNMLPAYGRGRRKLFPRTLVHLLVGKPIVATKSVDSAHEVAQARELSHQIMSAISQELAVLRDEQPTAQVTARWTPTTDEETP